VLDQVDPRKRETHFGSHFSNAIEVTAAAKALQEVWIGFDDVEERFELCAGHDVDASQGVWVPRMLVKRA